jgi:hypothetical protein
MKQNYTPRNLMSFQNFLGEGKRSKTKDKNPCWSGYRQVGFKTKNGRRVPNCVPIGKQSAVVQEQDTSELIDTLEDLGFKEKPKVWFLDWEHRVDGRNRVLYCLEAYTKEQAMLALASAWNIEECLDSGEWEDFVNQVSKGQADWEYLDQVAQDCNYREEDETLHSVYVMTHPKPRSLYKEPRSLDLFGEYNSSAENAQLMQSASSNLRSWYGISLEDVEKLKSDYFI